MNLEEFLDADPFEPTPAPAPKKRGRPAATKPKPAAKPRWYVTEYKADELITILREAARVLEPGCIGNIPKQLKVAAELLEMIETKKA
jgi:hypothetical protein